MDPSRLIQAYGRHWARDQVKWSSGYSWQMLGRIGLKRPGLRLCDFGYARGVYVLEWKRKPVYVGIARGSLGLAGRLVPHHRSTASRWTTFSWFSFDGVTDNSTRTNPLLPGWARIKDRERLAAGDVEARIMEMEAILVGLLGPSLTNVQKPKFGTAREWLQITARDFDPAGPCRLVDPNGFVSQTRAMLSP